jgi:hypothetical protein
VGDRSFSILSFPVVAVLLAVLVLALLFLGRAWGLGTASFYLLAIPIAIAVAYLAWYRTLPYEPHAGPTAVPVRRTGVVPDDEPFVDPVEEADELDRASSTASRPEATEERPSGTETTGPTEPHEPRDDAT